MYRKVFAWIEKGWRGATQDAPNLRRVAKAAARLCLAVADRIRGIDTRAVPSQFARLDMVLFRHDEGLLTQLTRGLPSKGVFWDVGANVGYFSAYVARFLEPSRVVAFEPNAELVQSALATLAGRYPSVEVLGVALGSEVCERNLFAGQATQYGSLSREYVLATSAGSFVSTKCVPVITGDQLLHEEFAAPDVVKIDVEGFELHVLRGMQELLDRDRRIELILEVNPIACQFAGYAVADLFAFLFEKGFSISVIEASGQLSRLVDLSFATSWAKSLGGGYANVLAEKQSTMDA